MLFGLFKNIKSYKELNSDEFLNAIERDSDYIIIDVRSPMDFKKGKIKGAQNIDVLSISFTESIKNLIKEKNYYIYCRSGIRSSNACRIMAKLGFKNLYNLKGGIINWKGPIL